MAWIQQDPSGNFHISFRFGGRKFKRSLKTSVAKQARLKRLRLEETIALVEAGRIDLPPCCQVLQNSMSGNSLRSKSTRARGFNTLYRPRIADEPGCI